MLLTFRAKSEQKWARTSRRQIWLFCTSESYGSILGHLGCPAGHSSVGPPVPETGPDVPYTVVTAILVIPFIYILSFFLSIEYMKVIISI